MVTFIYEHFDEEISVTDIAKAAFVSERECFRLFKTLLNTAPLTYYHSFNGHIGTHFDVENGVFPIDYCRRNGWSCLAELKTKCMEHITRRHRLRYQTSAVIT